MGLPASRRPRIVTQTATGSLGRSGMECRGAVQRANRCVLDPRCPEANRVIPTRTAELDICFPILMNTSTVSILDASR